MRLGVKAHWRDVDAMATLAERHGATVLEYQMLPHDLERHAQDAFDAFAPYRDGFELRVHQPEAYAHEGQLRFLDIASPDADERARGTAFLGEVARHAMELGAKALVIHPGGIWREPHIGGNPDLLRDALEDVPRHVKLLLENMPEHYALRGLALPPGRSPASFRIPHGLRHVDHLVDGYVLDISHAYLAAARGTYEVARAFVRELAPRIRHVHANGSRGGMGAAGEGTPFADSDYGADYVREILAQLPDDVVVVPEIMDGHHDGGALFDDGLAFLRALGLPVHA